MRFLPVVVIGSRSLAYQGAADAASQAREGSPLRPPAFLPPLPWNDLVEFALSIRSRFLAIYASHSAMCRSVSTKCLRSSSVTALSPILLGFALHCRRLRIFHFEPVRRASRTIGRGLPLRHDTFEPHLAGVGEDSRAIALDMLVEPDAGAGLGHDGCERGLVSKRPRAFTRSPRVGRHLQRQRNGQAARSSPFAAAHRAC
jgi:hypothetical protein